MKKITLAITILMITLLAFNTTAFAHGSQFDLLMQINKSKLEVSGNDRSNGTYTLDAVPIIKDGHILVPLSSVASALAPSCSVDWSEADSKIHVNMSGWGSVLMNNQGNYSMTAGNQKHIDDFMIRLASHINANLKESAEATVDASVNALGGIYIAKLDEDYVFIMPLKSDITLWIGKTTGIFNGDEFTLDYPPTIIDGVAMVPLSLFHEPVGYFVRWVEDTGHLIISEDEYVADSMVTKIMESPPIPEGHPVISTLNTAADMIYYDAAVDINSYIEREEDIPASSVELLLMALDTYQLAVDYAVWMDIIDDPQLEHTRKRISNIEGILYE